MINLNALIYKVKARVHRELFTDNKGKWFYWYLYKSFWHSKLTTGHNGCVAQFLTARPNPGAGIGHQLANWFSGYKIAKYLSLDYSVYPFSDLSNPFVGNDWETFLGLNDGEKYTCELLKEGYKLVLLPKIDYSSVSEIVIIKNIVNSYRGKRVIFLLEMDQFAGCELEMVDLFRRKFNQSRMREKDKLLFDENHFNVAIHIRRGDIVQTGTKLDPNLSMRWLDLEYYKEVLEKYLADYSENRVVDIYIFSQANKSELYGFEQFGNVIYCNDMDAISSFLHMAQSDFFIMSRSGMSYQAAKLNQKGVIIYPKGFWREPIESDKWILPE